MARLDARLSARCCHDPSPSAPGPRASPPSAIATSLVDRDRRAASKSLLCSDFPTQLALGGTLSALRLSGRTSRGALSVGYVVGAVARRRGPADRARSCSCSTRTANGRATCCSAGGRSLGEAALGVPLILVALAHRRRRAARRPALRAVAAHRRAQSAAGAAALAARRVALRARRARRRRRARRDSARVSPAPLRASGSAAAPSGVVVTSVAFGAGPPAAGRRRGDRDRPARRVLGRWSTCAADRASRRWSATPGSICCRSCSSVVSARGS